MNDATMVIMAGGKSSRMKSDKALLPFAGYRSLAEYQYQRYAPHFSKVYLSSKQDKFDFSADIIEDRYKDSSPLVALVSIFETLVEVDELFILSVDMPFITPEIIERLYAEAKEESSVIVAASPYGLEPLCGIYRRTLLVEAKVLLAEDNHRLQSLLKRVVTQKIWIEDNKAFMNLNHPSEYEEAMKLFHGSTC